MVHKDDALTPTNIPNTDQYLHSISDHTQQTQVIPLGGIRPYFNYSNSLQDKLILNMISLNDSFKFIMFGNGL